MRHINLFFKLFMIIYLISCVELQASDNEKGEIYQTLKKNLWKKR
jgi:hypothetical protein